MYFRRFTDFILHSRLQAMLVAFVAAFIPVIGSIGIVIAALVTLRRSIVDGALVFVASTLPYLLSYMMAYSSAQELDIASIAILVLVLSNALTWVLAVVLRRYHWSLVLELAALLGIVAVVLVHCIDPNIQDWWQAQLTTYLSKTVSAVETVNSNTDVVAAQGKVVNFLKSWATGLIVASILFNAMLQLLVARWWQAALFNPGGLRKELYRIRLGYVAAVLLLIDLLMASFGTALAIDCLPVLLTVFFAAGLSVVHYAVAPLSKSWLYLSLIYIAMIWLLPVSIFVIALIALFDTFINIRQRLKNQTI